MVYMLVRSILGPLNDRLRTDLKVATTGEACRNAVRSYLTSVVSAAKASKWTPSISYCAISIESRRFPTAVGVFTVNGSTNEMVEKDFFLSRGDFHRPSFFELKYPTNNNLVQRFQSLMVLLGDSANGFSSVGIPGPREFGLITSSLLAIPGRESKRILAAMRPPPYSEDISARRLWLAGFYEDNPEIGAAAVEFCRSYPEGTTDHDQEDAVLYALGNLAKFQSLVDDSACGSYFVPLALGSHGIGVLAFGLRLIPPITEQGLIDILANEIGISLWTVEQMIQKHHEWVPARNLALGKLWLHEARHLMSNQRLVLERTSQEGSTTEFGEATKDLVSLGEQMDAHLDRLQAQLIASPVPSEFDWDTFRTALAATIPNILLPDLFVQLEVPDGMRLEILGTSEELALAISPIAQNALIHGLAHRDQTTLKNDRAVWEAMNNLLSLVPNCPLKEVMLDNSPAVLRIIISKEKTTKGTVSTDRGVLRIEVSDCGDGFTKEMEEAIHFTPFSGRLPSQKPSGGYGLLWSLEVLKYQYDATVHLTSKGGVVIEIRGGRLILDDA